MSPNILVSAGEASSDLYASLLVESLAARYPGASFFGCAGVRMQAAGVRPVVDAARLSVVGLVEVLAHIPRIYGEFRKLVGAAAEARPDLAILTDSPDFHLRLAPKLKRLGIPVVYLIAPQAWAWREGRSETLRRYVDRLLCIFPFEEPWFRRRGVEARYIGHPLTRVIHVSETKEEFFRKHSLDSRRPLVALLPGSRPGEIARHLGSLVDAARRLHTEFEASMILATPKGFASKFGSRIFQERIGGASIQLIEGETWSALAHADAALAASGTVTIEAALLGTPMVTFYRVTPLSWVLGRKLVRVPFYSMVNLVAERRVVPEVMQHEATGERLATEIGRLLRDPALRQQMKSALADVARRLATPEHPVERAAAIVSEVLETRLDK